MSQAQWQEIIKNFTETANGADVTEKIARYAARENARCEHLVEVIGNVVASMEQNKGKDAALDEFFEYLGNMMKQGISDANNKGFTAQRQD